MSKPDPGTVELSKMEQEEFDGLPLYIKENLVCLCVEQGKRKTYEHTRRLTLLVPEYIDHYPGHVPSAWARGFFCTLCWKPTKRCVAHMVQTCDECEKYYVPREWPVRYNICAKCEGVGSELGAPLYAFRTRSKLRSTT